MQAAQIELVPLELKVEGVYNLSFSGYRPLTFPREKSGRRVELLPKPLAERIMGIYNRHRTVFVIAYDLMEVAFEQKVRMVVEQVLVERGLIPREVLAVPASIEEVPAVAESPGALSPEVGVVESAPSPSEPIPVESPLPNYGDGSVQKPERPWKKRSRKPRSSPVTEVQE